MMGLPECEDVAVRGDEVNVEEYANILDFVVGCFRCF